MFPWCYSRLFSWTSTKFCCSMQCTLAQQLYFLWLTKGFSTSWRHRVLFLAHRVFDTTPYSPRQNIVWRSGKYLDKNHISVLPSWYLLVTFVLGSSAIERPSLYIAIASAVYWLLINFGAKIARNSKFHLVSTSGQCDASITKLPIFELNILNKMGKFTLILFNYISGKLCPMKIDLYQINQYAIISRQHSLKHKSKAVSLRSGAEND